LGALVPIGARKDLLSFPPLLVPADSGDHFAARKVECASGKEIAEAIVEPTRPSAALLLAPYENTLAFLENLS
jgi:hypothetical protein